MNDKSEEVLRELKEWLLHGITFLKSDTYYDKDSKIKVDSKVSTMEMILAKIGELEKTL